MDLSNLTPEQIQELRKIAAQVHTTLEELLKEHQDVNALLESYKGQNFGILNEYEQNNKQILND